MDNYRPHLLNFLSMASMNGKFYCFDTETTGLQADADIIEITITEIIPPRKENGVIIPKSISRTLDLFINNGYPLPKEIVEFNEKNHTGITQERIEREGVSPEDAYYLIHDFWGDNPVVFGQNVEKFDLGKVSNLYRKTGHGEFAPLIVADTLRMAKEKIKKSKHKTTCDEGTTLDYKLASLVKFLGIENNFGFHSSLDDVRATVEVFFALCKLYVKEEPRPKDEPDLTLDGFAINYISEFYPSYQLHRIYVKNNLGAKIYYDIYNRVWYIGNRLPEKETVDLIYSYAGVKTENEFIAKYKKDKKFKK